MAASPTLFEREAPPENVETEAALLGALMVENRLIDRVSDKLLPEHFFEPLHGRIYEAILRESQLGRRATPISLKPYFADDEDIKQVGGVGYLGQLTGSGAGVIGALDFADQIVELARRRSLLAALQAITVRDYNKSFAEIVADAEAAIAEAGREESDGTVEISAGEAAYRAIRAGEASSSGSNRGVLCGITPIDNAIGPIRPKEFVLVGGRPGMGKSALGTGYALGAAKRGIQLVADGKAKEPVGIVYFSLEMSAEQLGARMISDLTFQADGRAVPYNLIERGELQRNQIRRVLDAKEELDGLPIEIVDIGKMTTGRLNSLTRRWKRRFAARGINLGLVIVDYAQLLRANSRTRDRIEAMTEVSIDLKALAKTNDVGVMALAQLSRAVEQREDKRPHMSDLRESGQFEQDADTILFLFRQEYYLQAAEPPEGDPGRPAWEAAIEMYRNKIEFLCAKRRMGETGKQTGQFFGAFAAMRELPL